MKNKKKILSILIKLLIGLGSLAIIYYRLRNELTVPKLQILKESALSATGLGCLFLCLLLMPLNWGIESYKWWLATRPVENIGFGGALRSVFSGVCLGNFAPGRATEFVAKILFFEEENRARITVLHFVNGMFQFSITVVIGFLALLVKLRDFGAAYSWLIYASAAIGCIMLSALTWCIFNIDSLLHFVAKKISRRNNLEAFHYTFKARTIVSLFGFSVIRYLVFSSQFVLLLFVFHAQGNMLVLLSGISVYFLITATIPMFSVVEAAIRAAVALVVFKGSGLSDAVVALCTVLMWLVNIVLPSLAGYFFLIRENFNFKSLPFKK